MRTIIAGTRKLPEYQTWRALDACPWLDEITEVVCGGATGPDTHGALWATVKNLPIKYFYPDYPGYGKRRAPVVRNEEMACYADALIAIWDGKSRGTRDMIQRAQAHGLRVFIYRTDEV